MNRARRHNWQRLDTAQRVTLIQQEIVTLEKLHELEAVLVDENRINELGMSFQQECLLREVLYDARDKQRIETQSLISALDVDDMKQILSLAQFPTSLKPASNA